MKKVFFADSTNMQIRLTLSILAAFDCFNLQKKNNYKYTFSYFLS